MKRTLIQKIPGDLPRELSEYLSEARIWDSSCSPEARVWYLEKGYGYYLKKSKKGSLANEAAMNAYFYKKGLGPEVVAYLSDAEDWLLTARVAGEDCTHAAYLEQPERLCDTLAQLLRALHEQDTSDCPIRDRMSAYFATALQNYKKGEYDLSYCKSFGFDSADAAYGFLEREKNRLCDRVLLHGDYCLPNVMLNDWRFSGFIDLGNGGIGDRHIDLYWGAWTLAYNLGTDRFRNRFLDAYGRDLADEEKIRIVAAAEAFG